MLAGDGEPRRGHVRLHRRRGVRGRPHVRRHHPPVRRAARLVSDDLDRRRCATRCAAERAGRAGDRRSTGPNVGRQAARATRTREPLGTLGDPDLDRVVARDALGELEAGPHRRSATTAPHGEARERRASSVFIESFAPPPRMMIFGAVDFTAALARVGQGARLPGDGVRRPRRCSPPAPRFPMADEVVVDWPDRYLDEGRRRRSARATRCACSPTTPSSTCPRSSARSRPGVGYLGAMGSRRTHDERVERLREAGVDRRRARRGSWRRSGSTSAPARPRRPRSSICAEIIALRTGARRPSLRDADGPIHVREPTRVTRITSRRCPR